MPERNRVIGLGARGGAKLIVETLCATGSFDTASLLGPTPEAWGKEVLDAPVLRGDGELSRQYDGVTQRFIGLDEASDERPRRRLYGLSRSRGLEVVDAVHPPGTASPAAQRGRGPTALAVSALNANAQLPENVLVNADAVVGHDPRAASRVHAASRTCVPSGVEVGTGSHGAVTIRDTQPRTGVIREPSMRQVGS